VFHARAFIYCCRDRLVSQGFDRRDFVSVVGHRACGRQLAFKAHLDEMPTESGFSL
jgi:hypothetical protein